MHSLFYFRFTFVMSESIIKFENSKNNIKQKKIERKYYLKEIKNREQKKLAILKQRRKSCIFVHNVLSYNSKL